MDGWIDRWMNGLIDWEATFQWDSLKVGLDWQSQVPVYAKGGGGGGWGVHLIIWACSFTDTITSSALHLLPLETWYPLFTPQLPTTTQFNSMSVMPSVIFCPPAFDVSLLANHWGIILFYFISLNFQIWFSGNILQFLHNKSMASVSYHSTIKVSIH